MPGIADNDRLRCAPFAVGEFLHRNEIDFAREGGAVIEGLADEIDQLGNVCGGDDMPSGTEHIQGLTVAEEDRSLPVTHDDVRADAVIADGGVIREAMDDFVRHFICIFNNIKDASHFFSPLC